MMTMLSNRMSSRTGSPPKAELVAAILILACFATLATAIGSRSSTIPDARQRGEVMKTAKKSDLLHVQLDCTGENIRVIVWMPYPCGKGELVRPGFRSLRTGWSYDDLKALGAGEHRIENRRPRRARIIGPDGLYEEY
jgi:hypothetical protein